MSFDVSLKFDAADDFFALLVKLAVPDQRMDMALGYLNSLEGKINYMSVAFDALKAEVAATRGAMDSATALIEGIAARIEAAREDPEALMALAADLRKDREELSTAVATDQAVPEPEPEPVDPEAPSEGTPPDAEPTPDPVVVPPQQV